LRDRVAAMEAHRWLKRLSVTPKHMWMTPRMMDIFILKEFRKVSLLTDRLQICGGGGGDKQTVINNT